MKEYKALFLLLLFQKYLLHLIALYQHALYSLNLMIVLTALAVHGHEVIPKTNPIVTNDLLLILTVTSIKITNGGITKKMFVIELSMLSTIPPLYPAKSL